MKTRRRILSTTSLIGLTIICMCWGCAGFEKKFDDWQSALREKLNFDNSADDAAGNSQTAYFVHTTRWSWETLGHVAEWYTEDAKNEKKLAAINSDVNPQKLAVGSRIRIPVYLLKTREPMPQQFNVDYRQNSYKHTVRWPGETLSLIASWYTGSYTNWRKLAAANPRINPNRIKNSDVIYIPPSLLKTRVPLPQKVAAKYTADYFAYTVRQANEKLEDIAEWYTGNPANWRLLAKANPDLKPGNLNAGDEVYIPLNLLKNRKPKPLSESATAASKPSAETPPPEPEQKPAADEKIKLFGPKQFPNS